MFRNRFIRNWRKGIDNMKKVWKKAACVGLGIILLAGTISTGEYGLSKKDKEIYEMACAQQENVNELGFRDFRLTDYPVVYYDGEHDYVVTMEGDSYQVTKRKPVLNTFAGTAYPVGDHYEIIVPTIDKFRKLFDTLNAAGQFGSFASGESVSFDKDSYGEKEQAATIWHEAFHAYQFTDAEDEITALLAEHSFENENFGENRIVKEVDSNPEIKAMCEKEMGLLKQAVELVIDETQQADAGENGKVDVDTLRNIILQYKQLEEERISMLPEDVLILEAYYTRLEGSAYYVEGCVYQSLYSEKAFKEQYVDDLGVYEEGSSKYYKIGMAQCRILDWLSPEWKADYDFSESFMNLIYESLGV